MNGIGSRAALVLFLPALVAAHDIRFAHAQPVEDPQSTAAAQALYEQATKALEEGQLDVACPKLAEVVRLEPRGAGGRMKLAHCYELQGRLASAWATYLAAESAARTSGQRDRARAAHDAVDRLRPRLSTLTVEVPKSAAVPFTVLRDGSELGRPQWGEPLPVDSGEHLVEVRRAGEAEPRFSARVTVGAEGSHERVLIPDDALREPPAAVPAPEPPRPPPPTTSDQRSSRPAPAPATAGGVPTWAFVVGAGGIVSGAGAIAFRAHAGAVESEQRDACGAALDECPRSFDVEGTNADKDASFGLFVGLGIVSLGALGVAATGAIVGASDVPPSRASAQPTISLGPGGVMLGGTSTW